MEYFESSEASDVRSAMQYEHLIKEIDIARPEGLELTLKDSAKQPGLSASTAQRFQMTKILRKQNFCLFLTKEAYSHDGLQTGKLDPTPLSVHQPQSEH